MVRCYNGHFTCAVLTQGNWTHIDDLCVGVKEFCTDCNFTYMNLLICNIWCNDCIILIKGDSKFTSCLQSIQTKNYFQKIIYLILSKAYVENVSSIFINKLTKYKIIFFFRIYTKSRPKSKKPVRIYILLRHHSADGSRPNADDKNNDKFYGWHHKKPAIQRQTKSTTAHHHNQP